MLRSVPGHTTERRVLKVERPAVTIRQSPELGRAWSWAGDMARHREYYRLGWAQHVPDPPSSIDMAVEAATRSPCGTRAEAGVGGPHRQGCPGVSKHV